MTKSIVLEVCREFKIEPSEFFGNRRRGKVTVARRLAIDRFKEAEFSASATARMMRRSYSTIQYWLHPEYREGRKHYSRQFQASRRKARASA